MDPSGVADDDFCLIRERLPTESTADMQSQADYLQKQVDILLKRVDSLQHDLQKKSRMISRMERRHVQAIEEAAKHPPPNHRLKPIPGANWVVPPPAPFKKDQVFIFPSIVSQIIDEFGIQDEVARFFHVCLGLHVEGTFALGEINLQVVFSILDFEQEHYGNKWVAPAHSRLAEHLFRIGLSPEDWEKSFPDPSLLDRDGSELSGEQKALLVRLTDFYERDVADASLSMGYEDDELVEEAN